MLGSDRQSQKAQTTEVQRKSSLLTVYMARTMYRKSTGTYLRLTNDVTSHRATIEIDTERDKDAQAIFERQMAITEKLKGFCELISNSYISQLSFFAR